jgi:peptidoglycan-N-acetylglucosamine deacetylase
MLEIAYRHGYRVALGSIFPLDTHIHSPWFASKHILFNARPGSMIILHDCGFRGQRTAKTLEIILPALYKKEYSVVTLSELFKASKN